MRPVFPGPLHLAGHWRWSPDMPKVLQLSGSTTQLSVSPDSSYLPRHTSQPARDQAPGRVALAPPPSPRLVQRRYRAGKNRDFKTFNLSAPKTRGGNLRTPSLRSPPGTQPISSALRIERPCRVPLEKHSSERKSLTKYIPRPPCPGAAPGTPGQVGGGRRPCRGAL